MTFFRPPVLLRYLAAIAVLVIGVYGLDNGLVAGVSLFIAYLAGQEAGRIDERERHAAHR